MAKKKIKKEAPVKLSLDEIIQQSMKLNPTQLQKFRTGQRALFKFFLDDVLARIKVNKLTLSTDRIVADLERELKQVPNGMFRAGEGKR